MARFAATELEADWVINSDADEFWWPRGGTLKDVFETIPARNSASCAAAWRHFLPRPDGRGGLRGPHDRTTVRDRPSPGTSVRSSTPTRRWRTGPSPDVAIKAGNHNAVGSGLSRSEPGTRSKSFTISLRSAPQMRSKSRRRLVRIVDRRTTLALPRAAHERGDGTPEELDRRSLRRYMCVDDEALVRGLASRQRSPSTRGFRDAAQGRCGARAETASTSHPSEHIEHGASPSRRRTSPTWVRSPHEASSPRSNRRESCGPRNVSMPPRTPARLVPRSEPAFAGGSPAGTSGLTPQRRLARP